MRRLSRRGVLGLLGTGALGLAGLRLGLPRWIAPGAVGTLEGLSPAARALVEAAFTGLDPSLFVDVHAHLVGLGAGGTGCWVNPNMRASGRPLERLRFDLYLAAAGVEDEARADQDYLERLLALHRAAHPRGKLMLLAFDHQVDERGEVVETESPFHTPDEYVLSVAEAHPEVLACVSIHPAREDALARLDAAAARGARAVKWLPNAMGIDPGEERYAAYYAKLVEHSLVLLTHTGLEKAVHAEESQAFGNPLHLRRPLEAGVTVLAAHCASLGESVDLEHPGRPLVPSFDLFLRLMHDPSYEGRLFGEISALTQVNRSGRPLRELLAAPELHPRLVNGSDYPLPAIDPVVSTRWLVWNELLAPEDRRPLNELFHANPLLFDFVLKRRLRLLSEGAEARFLPMVFESARLFST